MTDDEPTATTVLSKDEHTLLRYIIRQTDDDKSPMEEARYWMERLLPNSRWMPMMYADETTEDPMSQDEMLDLLENRRVELTRTQDEQLQMCVLAFMARTTVSEDHDRLGDIEELLDGILAKLESAHGEIWEELDEEEREEESDEAAVETLSELTDVDEDEIKDVVEDS